MLPDGLRGFHKALGICGVWLVLVLNGGVAADDSQDEQLEASAVEGCSTDVKPPTPGSRPLQGAQKVLPPSTGAYAGLYASAPASKAYTEFVDKTSGNPPILFIFHEWTTDEDFGADDPRLLTLDEVLEEGDIFTPLQLAEALSQDGTVLAVAWAIVCCDPTSQSLLFGLERPWNIFSRALRGEFDSYIRKVARQVKQFGRPIMLSVTGEFTGQGPFMFGKSGTEWITEVDNICNQYGDPAWPDGPERIRDVYMHIIDIFREEEVRNVTWFMYAVSNYMTYGPIDDTWGHPKYYYPGDAYIDWVGQSVYFVDSSMADPSNEEGMKDFHGALSAGYEAWIATTNRPIFLPEFGIVGDGQSSRAKLMEQAFGTLVPAFPRVKALTFADSDLFAELFELPRLGQFADEIEAWRKFVWDNPYYVDRVILGAR